LREHSGTIQRALRKHSKSIQGTFRQRSGSVQKAFREQTESIQGTFREHSGNIDFLVVKISMGMLIACGGWTLYL
jgi:hypothetical protein